MYKILVLASSGFGKTLSLGCIPEIKHKGLDPKTTFLISVTTKALPFPHSTRDYKVCTPGKLDGNRYITNNPKTVMGLIKEMSKSKVFENIVIDDFNYIMQDYYMKDSLKGGWDTPKQIGFDVSQIFTAMDMCTLNNKNIIVLAHPESVPLQDGRIYYKMKTTGKMVDDYITPEGKFDIVLLGVTFFDSIDKTLHREFITSADEMSSSPKSPLGMFPEINIKNDLGIVIEQIKKYSE